MSGHSKWATIKRDKAVNDGKKSIIFTKISRAITAAAKQGGGDPDTNSFLRIAVEKAREARMPKENVDKAINKGTGAGDNTDSFEEAVYEGYGPLGTAVLIHALTDNKNRTVSEVRSIFFRYGGSLGTVGSTSYIFKGQNKSPTFEASFSDPRAQASEASFSDPRAQASEASFYVESRNEEDVAKVMEFLDMLEGCDDIQNVYHNFKRLKHNKLSENL